MKAGDFSKPTEDPKHRKNQFSIAASNLPLVPHAQLIPPINESASKSASRNPPIQEEVTNSTAESPHDLNALLKKLNKPEMLLLNHLQNQIKLYYPDQAKKHKWLQEELGLLSNEDPLLIKNKTYDLTKLTAFQHRRASENSQLTATLLPPSLKAKMKNLIQTLE